MIWKGNEILSILDNCCQAFTFPMLDNGYVYLAATRLSLYRSSSDWGMVIEVFGFSPRSGIPDIQIYTFASQLYNRDSAESYVTSEAYDNYLKLNPHNDTRFFFPIEEGTWLSSEECESVDSSASSLILRGATIPLPDIGDYSNFQVSLEESPQIQVYELCRVLAAKYRDGVLASQEERRVSILPTMQPILQLEEWNHPDVVDEEALPSRSETFQQLAKVLETGDVTIYNPSLPPNTHWSHWPEGGLL